MNVIFASSFNLCLFDSLIEILYKLRGNKDWNKSELRMKSMINLFIFTEKY